MDRATTEKVVCLLTCAPSGVQTMSQEIPGLVQTSLNLGVLTTGETALTATFCVRSSLSSEKELLKDRLVCLTEQLGGTTAFFGDYPPWEYRRESALRERMTAVFRAQYGREPKLRLSTRLECDFFPASCRDRNACPSARTCGYPHAPGAMSIASVQRVGPL